ncbi:MAG: MerR family transcriptional regulator [Oscillospiraceae bacterium]
MNELIKIRDVSAKYDISARTLRYYEDMGLINSIRSNDYAYRMYDDTAVKRLEQILILRKLNISIKDIQRIFSTSDSEVVLEVLSKKVDDIDGEVSLLHELKEIVLEFIRQIKNADFGRDSDVKLLYEKAKEIETQIVNVDYDGNAANVNRLFEVTEKLAVTSDIVEKRSYCYLIFNLGSKSNVLEACEMYGKAFGAEKLSEDISAADWINDWIGIDIKLFNFTIFMQSTSNPRGGNCCIKFTSPNELQKAYDVIKEEAIECSLNSDWHWTPLSAIIKDKFGVNWLFCV